MSRAIYDIVVFEMTFLLVLVLALAAPAFSAITFSKDVAPVLNKHCVACHRAGNIAPMAFTDYKSARPWAKSIKQAVLTGKMPPWFADPKHGSFANDPRLAPREIAALKEWADGGAPEGNPRDLPPPVKFVEGWQMGKPDIVIDIGEDHKVTAGEDAYEHFVVPTNFREGKWIRAAEILPGNRRVVHHVHVLLVQDNLEAMAAASTANMPALSSFLLREGKLTRIRADAPVVDDACTSNAQLPFLTGGQEGSFTAFLPGRQPDQFPDGTAKWIPPGAKLEFVVHYAQIAGEPQTDRTSVGFYLAAAPPDKPLRRMDLRNFFLKIPAGAANHEVRRCYTFEKDTMLISFTPHMHYRGKDARYELTRPDGRRETLLSVPRYDFNWQLNYRLRDPVFVEKGSTLTVTVHYDNSANNRANPDPKSPVRWGDKTEEEMMTSWIEYIEAAPKNTSRR